MQFNSGAWLPKHKVITACEAVIFHIEKNRKEMTEKLIQKEMNKKRWFRDNYTREEAIFCFK